ncbi:ROK family protein [Clostridium sp. MCC353]|uniref:ROK family protein n=1 Tax=Clostridium sp. MCC353 TaxID=2592646 RepID=UPI001C0194BA|nr:ROK family protein [Clostridium sp. MCC353]MBT9776724.1 ROK family protein [Clostridium sp. MCC353]
MCRKSQKYDLLFDVGGTAVKLCAVKSEQPDIGTLRLEDRMDVFPSGSNGSREQILNNFSEAVMRMEEEKQIEIERIGMAFPGPFDYERGISYMHGLNKYDAIYGCNIGEAINVILKTAYPFVFMHDAEAFALGECRYGKARDAKRAMYLCIGTGTGSAFTDSGFLVKKEGDGVPDQGWVYDCPFRDARIDDYLSARGLERLAVREFGRICEGKELYEMACGAQGSESRRRAVRCFQEFGRDVADAVKPFLERFEPEIIVLGGQISASFSFFGDELRNVCEKKHIKADVAENTSSSIMKGLYYQLKEVDTGGVL